LQEGEREFKWETQTLPFILPIARRRKRI
jgi:hypothetical protein